MIKQETINQQAEGRWNARKTAREAHAKVLDAIESGKGFKWSALEDVERLASRARRLGLFEAAGALLRDPEDTAVGNQVLEQIISANNQIGRAHV